MPSRPSASLSAPPIWSGRQRAACAGRGLGWPWLAAERQVGLAVGPRHGQCHGASDERSSAARPHGGRPTSAASAASAPPWAPWGQRSWASPASWPASWPSSPPSRPRGSPAALCVHAVPGERGRDFHNGQLIRGWIIRSKSGYSASVRFEAYSSLLTYCKCMGEPSPSLHFGYIM